MLYGRAKRDSSIATSSFDAIATIDAEGRFTFLPPTVKRTTDYRVEELVGRPFQGFFPGSAIPKTLQDFREVARDRPVEGLQLQMSRKDGCLAC